jgi:hyaluronoglucosaminidase
MESGFMRVTGVLFALLVALSQAGCGGGSTGAGEPAMLGAIEGFYGPLYTFDQRLDLLRFLPEAGLNTYVYAPKLDPYHRNRWRDPYPPEWLAHFHELASTADDLGLRFVFALSPGAGFDPDAGDQAVVEAKLATLLERGVRHFCLFFDDLTPGSRAAEPPVQVALISDTLAFLRGRDRDASLCFISHYYAGTADELRADRSPFDGTFAIPSSATYAAYAAIPREVPILWTGPRVFSRLTVADTADYRAFAGRPVVIWDNFPVNDIVLSRELFLSPYRDREAGIARVAGGVLLNLMLQPEASKIALHTAGRFFAAGARYDPEAALAPALAVVAGSAAGGRALAPLAEQFHSHPLIGHVPESPRLAARTAAFLATRSADDEAALRALLAELAAVEDDLARAVPNRALVAELAPAAHKLSLLAEAGILALDLLDQQARGEAADDTQLCATLRAARAIPWLVAANSPVGPPLDQYLSGQDAERADVFGDFFAALAVCSADVAAGFSPPPLAR